MRFTISISVLAVAAGLAACGSTDPSAASSTSAGSSSSSNSKSGSTRALAFAQCMRSHGVSNFPDPGSSGRIQLQLQRTPNSTSVNGVEVNGPAFQNAMQACHSYLPGGGQPSPAQSAQLRAKGLAMARCMRSHGVPNFPDPQFQSGPGGGVGIRISGTGVNPNSPAFQAAQRACGSIIGAVSLTGKAP